jgi:hypothetical protein
MRCRHSVTCLFACSLQTFDVYELCTDELQRKLRNNRIIAAKAYDDEMAQKRAKTSADATPGTSAPTSGNLHRAASCYIPNKHDMQYSNRCLL